MRKPETVSNPDFVSGLHGDDLLVKVISQEKVKVVSGKKKQNISEIGRMWTPAIREIPTKR